jgi:predicted esterase
VLALVRTGRLVCFPVYKGMLERRFGELVLNFQRDAYVMTAKDLRRTVDYLHTRDDVDARRLIYCGLSQGALRGPVMLVVEPRFKAAVLLFGGYWRQANGRPEMEPLKFTRAVKTPVLMINGMLDNILPYEPYQTLFYQHLGSVDKRFLPIENETHGVPPAIVIPAVDKWLRARWPAEQP